MSIAAAVSLLCAYLVLLILRKTFSRKRSMKLPPLAAGALPVVGHTLGVLAKKERLYRIIAKDILGASLKKGIQVVTVRLVTWKLYVVMNPDDGNLVTNSCLNKDMIYKFFKPWLGDEGLVTAEEPIWKRHRKLLIPTFNQSVLDTYLTAFNDQSRNLVKNLSPKDRKGSFDQMPYIKHTLMNIGCETIMGVSVDEDELKKQFIKSYDIFTDCMVERIRKFWYHNNFLFSLSKLKKKQDAAVKSLHEMSYKIIREKKTEVIVPEDKSIGCEDSSKPRFKSFLDLLLDLSKEGALTESETREEVETFITAASDTTSHALGTTLLTIGTYPEVQQKVFKELQEVFEGSDRDVERQDLSRLKYLEAVIKETARLYPIIFFIGRTIDKDLNLKNYTLPAGSSCLISIYSICRHPMWGDDAEQFRPERWLDGSLPTNSKAYAVFGLGKRSCLGSKFAMMSMKTVLAHVVRRYHISGDVTQLVQNIDVICRMVSGHHISIERREAEEVSKNN